MPVHDDLKWFEFIVLDAFQAGLSWRTVLHKREAFRKVFKGFDPNKVARLSEVEMEAAQNNPAIIRNRLKIRATVKNASAFLKLQENHGTFDAFIWQFTEGKSIENRWKTMQDIPASTPPRIRGSVTTISGVTRHCPRHFDTTIQRFKFEDGLCPTSRRLTLVGFSWVGYHFRPQTNVRFSVGAPSTPSSQISAHLRLAVQTRSNVNRAPSSASLWSLTCSVGL